jgi:cell division protein ZapA
MAVEEHVVQVEIFGELYTLRAKEDPHYVRQVAQYVDSKFYEIAKGSLSIPSDKLAVLASLNIADELMKLMAEKEKTEAEAVAKIGELVELLEAGLRS